MARRACLLLVLLFPVVGGGCAAVGEFVLKAMIEASLEAAFETKEDRHIRKDFHRHRQGQPLKHHRNFRELQRHQHQREHERSDC